MMLLFFAGFSIAAALITAVLARLTEIELPDPTRRMRSGGLFIWTSVLLALIAIRLFILGPEVGISIDATVIALALIVLVGVADDLYDLSWRTKLGLQIACLFPLGVSFGAILPSVSAPILAGISVGLAIWLLVVTNGANLMDGIDGYLGTWSLVTLSGLLFVTYQSGAAIPIAEIGALAIGPLILFVTYNQSPARVFLGDAGSLSFGFLTAMLAAMLLLHQPDLSRLLSLLVVMTLPVLEVFSTIVRRKRAGKPVFSSDLDHIHHRLVVAMGGSVVRAAGLLITVQVMLLLVAYVIDQVAVPVSLLGFVMVWVLVTAGLFRLRRGSSRTIRNIQTVPSLNEN